MIAALLSKDWRVGLISPETKMAVEWRFLL
jgi:hypothetical protein